jgi:amphiphysin
MDPLRSLVDMRFSAVDGFELQKESISSLFRDVSLLTNVNNGIAGQSSTGQFDDDDDGNDANEAATNPFHPANTETPAQPPPVSTNPFFPIPGTAGSSGTPVISAKPVPLPISKKPAVPLPQTQQQKPPTKPAAVCLFDFDPQQAGDLKIRKGDRLEVLERTEDANGWWRGRLISSGEEGLFPGNYVRLMQ